MNITFRQADINDFEDVLKLYKQVIKTTFTTWDKDYPSKDMIKDDIQSNRLLVMLDDNKIIGVAAVDDNKFIDEGEKIGGFARICVSPDYQHQGLGTKLVKYIIEKLKTSGCKKIKLRVSINNPTAIKMYERCGFSRVGTDYNFELEWFLYELVL